MFLKSDVELLNLLKFGSHCALEHFLCFGTFLVVQQNGY